MRTSENGDLWRLCLYGGILRAEPVEPKRVRHCVRSEETEREWVVSRGTGEQQVNARMDAECNTKEVSAKIVAAKFGAGAGGDQCVVDRGQQFAFGRFLGGQPQVLLRR